MTFRKPYQHHWAFLALLVVLFLSSTTAKASDDLLSDIPAQEKPLIEALKEIEENYQIFFTYEAKLLKDVTVDYHYNAEETVEHAINRVLAETNFQFKTYSSKFIVIYKDDRRGRKGAKKIGKKIRQIEKLEQRNKISLERKDEDLNDAVKTIVKSVQELQERVTVTGKVTDEAGEPLIGVNILVKGSGTGTITDVDGKFSLKVEDADATLVISYIGFQTVEVPLNGRTDITVALEPSAKSLDEVVVVGFGTQKKVNLTGAVETIDSKDLKNRPITNASQALQGAQGVYVNQVGSQPGRDGATIRIRGVGTLNNANPLVLVDGIEFPIGDINPNDIESISVLKDASSAAIYGSRAANGVILVTTKKGSQKDKLNVTYSGSVGVQEVISLPDMVQDPIQWFELYRQAQRNVGVSEDALVFSEDLVDEYRNGMVSNPEIYQNNDWYDLMFDPAPIQEHNVRISGGLGKSSYSFSLGYLDQDGVLRGTKSKRYNFNLSARTEVNDRLTIGGGAIYSLRNWDEPSEGVGRTMQMILKAQSYHPTYDAEGNYAMNFFDIPGHRRFRHPLALTDEGQNSFDQGRLLLNAFAEIELPLGIVFKTRVGVNSSNRRQQRFTPEIPLYDIKTGELTTIQAGGPNITFSRQRGVNQRDEEFLNTTLFNTLNWDKYLNNDQVYLSVLVGQSAESFTSSNFSASNEGYLTNDFFELNAGSTNPSVSGTSAENRLTSYFGRINLVFKDKYLFEVNSRYDGSSRFAKGNRWGFFPSFSAGWRLDQEAFLADVTWLSQLKLRGSWGQLGNERIGNFRFADFISPGQDYGFGGMVNTGTAVRVDNDDQISWETTTISNIALDAGFFNGKLNASVEYFDKTTDGVLRPVGIPSQVGNLGGPTRNIGSISNKGVELNLGIQDRKGDFGYQLSGNVTYLQNEVTNLNGEVIINDFSIDRRGPLNITQEGAPINQYYLFQSDGYFQNQAEIDAHPSQGPDTRPGFIRFKDINDDGVIDNEDRVATGNVIPEFTYTFNINFSYKNWSLNSFWQGVEGVDTYNKHVSGVPFWFGTGVPTDWANDSWTPENPDASLPILMRYQDGVSTQFRDSDFWLLDASYLRLKNLQLRYDFGSRVLDALGLQELVLYANAQNLLTITDLEDFDPETRLLGGNFFNYPSARTYTFGVNVTF